MLKYGWLVAIVVALANSARLPAFEVSDQELAAFGNQLRSQDENRVRSGIRLSYQGHTSTRGTEDNAKDRLFARVDESMLRKPTFRTFVALIDNYNAQTGERESDNAQKRAEVNAFLEAVYQTRIWKTFYQFLRKHDHPYARDESTLKESVKHLWFDHYSRARGVPDTSGFEHVFMGEAKNGEVSGMHNWVTFYLREKNSSSEFDYKGFVVKRFNVMAAVRYTWRGLSKPGGTFLVGTSPEFDLILYTTCFLARRGRSTCNLELDGCPLMITSYDLVQQNHVYVGSVFPSAGRMTDECRRRNS